MKKMFDLSQVTEMFLMNTGAAALHDIDTPAFMRKEFGIDVGMMNIPAAPAVGRIVEPDKKIADFLTVIKRKDFLPKRADIPAAVC